MNGEWELLPCPFCGSANVLLYEKAGITTTFFIECQVCFSQSGDYGLAELAIKAWNTRPTSAGQGVTDEMVEIARQAAFDKSSGICVITPNAMRAALESVALPARVPDGWKLVPIEPTDLMLNSFLGGYGARGGSFNATHLRDRAREGYRELLLAAPSPKAQKS